MTCVGWYLSNIAAVETGSHKFASCARGMKSPVSDALFRSTLPLRACVRCPTRFASGTLFPDGHISTLVLRSSFFLPEPRSSSHLGRGENPLLVLGLGLLDHFANSAPDETAPAGDQHDLLLTHLLRPESPSGGSRRSDLRRTPSTGVTNLDVRDSELSSRAEASRSSRTRDDATGRDATFARHGRRRRGRGRAGRPRS